VSIIECSGEKINYINEFDLPANQIVDEYEYLALMQDRLLPVRAAKCITIEKVNESATPSNPAPLSAQKATRATPLTQSAATANTSKVAPVSSTLPKNPPRHIQLVDLGPELKTRFHVLCQREGHTPSALLRKMVQHIVDHNADTKGVDRSGSRATPAASANSVTPAFAGSSTTATAFSAPRRSLVATRLPDTGTKRVELRLRDSEFEHLQQQANVSGDSVQQLIVALVRAHLVAEPVMTDVECKALSESNYQLAVMGTTLNQIGRKLSGADCHSANESTAFGAEFVVEWAALRVTLNAHIAQVQALLSAQHLRGRIEL
jgi:uncharacterized protein (DUF1778 family)